MLERVSRWRYELLALAIALLGAGIHVATNAPIVGITPGQRNVVHRAVAQLEGRATDFKFRLRGARPPNPDVVVVAIDEKSAQKYGRWPWSRSVLAGVIRALVDAKVKAVGLDMVFSETTADEHETTKETLEALEEEGSLSPVLQALKTKLEARQKSSPDQDLEEAFRYAGSKVTQGSILISDARGEFTVDQVLKFNESLERWLLRTIKTAGADRALPLERVPFWYNETSQTSLEGFASAGSRIGFFSTILDVDGTIRRTAIFSKLTSVKPVGLLPSIALQTAAQTLDATIEPIWNGQTLEGATLKKPDGSTVSVPFEGETSFTLVDYDGPSTNIRTESAVDIKEGLVADLEGKTVLIGVTIVGSSGDQRVTPFKELEPGVFTHAAFLGNLLRGQFMTRPQYFVFLEALAVLVLCIAMAALIGRTKSFIAKALVVLVGVGLYAVIDVIAFNQSRQLATVVPLATLLSSAVGTIFLGYLSVDREKLKMRSTFTRYLGEDVMEVALANPDLLNRGEKREMTVMFSDIRGFTTLSERMSPEALADFINQYLSPMTKIVFEEKGTLDKYIGDALMAFWNAPLPQPDHAIRACRACVKMLKKLDELKVDWRAKGLPELEIGIGLNTGPMIVGNMGSDVRVDYTVLGDAVNLGSRLEGTNKEYDTKIIIAESTWRAAKDVMICRRLGAVRVKGKKLPVNIYELRGEGVATGDEAKAIETFELALDAWKSRAFGEAKRLFEAVLVFWPDDFTCRKYLAEIEAFSTEPPGPDFDGVIVLKTK